MLVFNPYKRFNARECLSHFYFNDIDTDRQDSPISTTTMNQSQVKGISEPNRHHTTTQASSSSQTNFTDPITEDIQCSIQDSTRTDSGLGNLPRSDSGLSDSFVNENRTFSRADSGICVSPPPVSSDNESSSSGGVDERTKSSNFESSNIGFVRCSGRSNANTFELLGSENNDTTRQSSQKSYRTEDYK